MAEQVKEAGASAGDDGRREKVSRKKWTTPVLKVGPKMTGAENGPGATLFDGGFFNTS